MWPLNYCCAQPQSHGSVLTVVKQEVSKSYTTLDGTHLLNTKCFIIVRTGGEENGTLRYENGVMGWDSIEGTVVDFVDSLDATVDEDGSLSVKREAHLKYIFDMRDIQNNRPYLKAETSGYEVDIVCILRPRELAKMVATFRDDRFEHFVCQAVDIPPPTPCHFREIGAMCIRHKSQDDRSEGELCYLPFVQSIEHTDSKSRDRIIVNGEGSVLIYDGADDEWVVTTSDVESIKEDVERYVVDKVWSGDESSASVDMPVIVCGANSVAFTSGTKLSEEKQSDLIAISNDNLVSVLPAMQTKDGSMFKHARSVKLKCMSMSRPGLVDVMQFQHTDPTPADMGERTQRFISHD